MSQFCAKGGVEFGEEEGSSPASTHVLVSYASAVVRVDGGVGRGGTGRGE